MANAEGVTITRIYYSRIKWHKSISSNSRSAKQTNKSICTSDVTTAQSLERNIMMEQPSVKHKKINSKRYTIMKIVELISDELPTISVEAISVVESPAIEEDFVALKSQEFRFAEQDKERKSSRTNTNT